MLPSIGITFLQWPCSTILKYVHQEKVYYFSESNVIHEGDARQCRTLKSAKMDHPIICQYSMTADAGHLIILSKKPVKVGEWQVSRNSSSKDAPLHRQV